MAIDFDFILSPHVAGVKTVCRQALTNKNVSGSFIRE
jgi:hypothetical protein